MLNTPPPKLAFSVAETCAALGLGKTNLYRMIAAGEIETIRIGGRRLVPAASIQALLDGRPATFAERTSTTAEK
jgi:excisionase family DNA binding protein